MKSQEQKSKEKREAEWERQDDLSKVWDAIPPLKEGTATRKLIKKRTGFKKKKLRKLLEDLQNSRYIFKTPYGYYHDEREE